MDTLTLYRGDFEKIKRFEFNRTSKSCLFGQGIYLTNSLEIANSYRHKGNNLSHEDLGFRFSGLFYTIEEALDAALPSFAAFSQMKFKSPQDKRNARWQLQLAYEDKRVKITASRPNTKLASRDYKHRADQKKDLRQQKYHFILSSNAISAGYISEFRFPSEVIQATMIPMDLPLKDETPLEILRDSGVVPNLKSTTSLSKIPDLRSYLRPMQRVFKSYGYKGFEYMGGYHLSGNWSHRAFVVWDEDFVNQHKVRRFV